MLIDTHRLRYQSPASFIFIILRFAIVLSGFGDRSLGFKIAITSGVSASFAIGSSVICVGILTYYDPNFRFTEEEHEIM